MPKIFQKVPSDFTSKNKAELLHEFSLLKTCHQSKKPVFLRVFETYMVISKVFKKSYKTAKICSKASQFF